jgi:predicted helicase
MVGTREAFDPSRLRKAAYRPFFAVFVYQSSLFIDRPGSISTFFPPSKRNTAICLSDVAARTDWVALAVDGPADLHFGASVDAYQQVPFQRVEHGEEIDNITDWSLDQFKKHYQPGRGKKERPITKEAIFHYVYGVLHDPLYREKYALNLKREFPRIPFYADFWQWADWGRALMDLHIGYESVAPFALTRTDVPDEKARRAGLAPKAFLRANKETRASGSTARRRSRAFRPKRGTTSSATAARSNGCSTSTRKGPRAIRRSARSSTPTASPTTRRR